LRHYPLPKFNGCSKRAQKIAKVTDAWCRSVPYFLLAIAQMQFSDPGVTPSLLSMKSEVRSALVVQHRFGEDRMQVVDKADRPQALDKLLVIQKQNVTELFRMTDGIPVSARLLDRLECERFGIPHPEICEMQARTIFEAAAEVGRSSKTLPKVEIVVPLVGTFEELKPLKGIIEKTADAIVKKEQQITFTYKIGTVIEYSRAALPAG
jgi:hypothetical protein